MLSDRTDQLGFSLTRGPDLIQLPCEAFVFDGIVKAYIIVSSGTKKPFQQWSGPVLCIP